MKACPQHGMKGIVADTGRCHYCAAQHGDAKVGKAHLRRGDRPLPHDYDAAITMIARGSNQAEAAAFLGSLRTNDVRRASLQLMLARPSGVSKERFGVAVRSASREPMLNANPDTIRGG